MIIKKLTLSNFQVIEKFDADFTGAIYFITGDNELGKSTLLKAIGALLTGKRDDVLRNGASKGFAKMVVGDDGEEFEVSLSFTEANPRGTLTIKQASTGLNTSNVSMLQRIFGYQDFDALEFSRWSETAEGRRKQIAVVKSLLPDAVKERIEEIDSEVANLKAERTGVNRDVKTFEGFVKTIAAQLSRGDLEKYASPVDVSELMEKQRTNVQLIEKAKTARQMLAQRVEQLAAIPGRISAVQAQFDNRMSDAAAKLQSAIDAYNRAVEAFDKAKKEIEAEKKEIMRERDFNLESIEEDRKTFEERKANAETWLAKYEKINPEKTDVPQMLAEAEAHNKKYNLVCQYKEKAAQYKDIKAKSEDMDRLINDLSDERAELIANADLPIEGLSFGEDGLTLNGIPFMPGKVSDSQTMEIAAKLVIASNPTVKVFRIARGESLGSKRLQTIIDLAKRNGYQGFIEQVQRGQDTMMVEEYTEE